MVPIQLKNFTPVGTAISIVMKAKKSSITAPVVYMVRPHGDRQRRDRDRRAPPRSLEAEDRLAREHRDDLRGDAEEGQCEDVHLGVAEEPEQVLPQDRPPLAGSKMFASKRRSARAPAGPRRA